MRILVIIFAALSANPAKAALITSIINLSGIDTSKTLPQSPVQPSNEWYNDFNVRISVTMDDTIQPEPVNNPGVLSGYSYTDAVRAVNLFFSSGDSYNFSDSDMHSLVTVGPWAFDGTGSMSIESASFSLKVDDCFPVFHGIVPDLTNCGLAARGHITFGNISADMQTLSAVFPPTPVPVPATAWLLLTGVSALGAVIRQRKPKR